MNRTPCLYLFPEDSAHSSLDSTSSIEFLHDQASFLLKSFINRLLSSTREAEEEIVLYASTLLPLSPHKETTNNSKAIFFHFFPPVKQVFTSSSSSPFAVCLPIICSIQKFKILHATTSRLFLLSSLQTPEQERKKQKSRILSFFNAAANSLPKKHQKSQIVHVANLFFNVDSKLVWALHIQRSFVR